MSACTCSVTPLVLDLACPVHGDEAARLVEDAIDAGTLIAAQAPGRCALCGKVEETRPYGPNGEEVCFSCGMKDEAAAETAFSSRFGVSS